MIWGRIRGVVKGREMTEEEKKVPAAGEKGSRKRTVVIAAAIAAIVVLGGAGGGYAYAANEAYESYGSQVESAKAIDAKLVKKIEDAQSLAKATKDTDVLDKTVLDSLNASVKSGEAQKGSPKAEDVNRWMLWDVSKAKTTVADDISAATKAISSIDAAMGKVDASKTAKQVKDAKDALNKTITDAETLYKDSEGKVQDDKTRESLKAAIDLSFIEWLGENGVPFAIVFTKADKLKGGKINSNIRHYLEKLHEQWEELPPYFVTSSENRMGREELLNYIEQINKNINSKP